MSAPPPEAPPPAPRWWERPESLALGALFAVCMIAASPAWSGAEGWAFHDLAHHHLPWRGFAARSWAEGLAPLWAPIGHGYPLLADGQVGALYPPNIVLGRLAGMWYADPRVADANALDWSVGLHTLWAAWGAWWLARLQQRSLPAATISALVFALSGFLWSHLVYLGMFHTITWAPLMIGTLAIAVRRGGSWVARAALVFAMAWLAGHAQVALLLTYGAAWMVASEVWDSADRRVALVRAAGVGVIAALLALPQLAATAELVAFGDRRGGVDAAFAAIGSLPPEELVQFVWPGFFGVDRPADVSILYHHRAGDFVGRGVSWWEDTAYLGVIPWALALLARGGGTRRWASLGAVGLLLALGAHTPLYPLFRLLPGMDYLRFPVRGLILVTLAVSQLAGIGLDTLLVGAWTRPERLRRPAIVVGALAALAGGGLLVGHFALLAASPAVTALLAQRVRVDPLDTLSPDERAAGFVARVLSSTDPAQIDVWWPVAALALLAVAMWGASRGRWSPAALALLSAAGIAVDLAPFARHVAPPSPTAEITQRPAASTAQMGVPGPYRTTTVPRRLPTAQLSDALAANVGLWWGAEDVIVPSPLRMSRNERYLEAAGLDLGLTTDADALAKLRDRRALLDLSGVRWLLSPEDPALDGFHEVPLPGTRAGEPPIRLWENERAFPRAFLAGCTTPPVDSDALSTLLTIDDLRNTVVVEGAQLDLCDPTPAGEVHIERYAPGRYTLVVDAQRDAFLVLTESWYPGWAAWIGEDAVDIYRADEIFQGFIVPKGRHTVVIAYAPAYLLGALALSAAVAGLAVARAVRAAPR